MTPTTKKTKAAVAATAVAITLSGAALLAERDAAVARAEALEKREALWLEYVQRRCGQLGGLDRPRKREAECARLRAALGLDDGNNPTSETPEGEL